MVIRRVHYAASRGGWWKRKSRQYESVVPSPDRIQIGPTQDADLPHRVQCRVRVRGGGDSGRAHATCVPALSRLVRITVSGRRTSPKHLITNSHGRGPAVVGSLFSLHSRLSRPSRLSRRTVRVTRHPPPLSSPRTSPRLAVASRLRQGGEASFNARLPRRPAEP